MSDKIKEPKYRTTEEKLVFFLADEDYGIAHIYPDGRLCHCNNKDIDGLYLTKPEAEILLDFVKCEPEIMPIRILKVGSIKNKWLRRLALILWHPVLISICISMNAVTWIIAFIKLVGAKVVFINKDFLACWKEAK